MGMPQLMHGIGKKSETTIPTIPRTQNSENAFQCTYKFPNNWHPTRVTKRSCFAVYWPTERTTNASGTSVKFADICDIGFQDFCRRDYTDVNQNFPSWKSTVAPSVWSASNLTIIK